MNAKIVSGALVAALCLSACSSRPREFRPTLAAPAADAAQFDAALAGCQQLFVQGKLDTSGRSSSGVAGAATGATTAAVGGAAAATAGGYAGLAAAAATVVLLPFAVLGGAWGMSRVKRTKKERAIKTALGGCLRDRGYEVVEWVPTGRKVPKPD